MSITREKIRQSVIGEGLPITTPFGERPLIYADYTASGRSLQFIEEAIAQRVLPYYANTHSESSYTGRQSTVFREQAREAIHRALNTSPAHKVIFTGSGATAGINKLIDMLNLRLPAELDERYALAASIPEAQRPVVFIGPYEHHSNELPWRESIATLVTIGLTERGEIDIEQLADELKRYRDRPLLIGSFSAASNVTGIKSDVAEISRLLKSHGALSCWDYAAAAPYVGIDVQRDQIDALYISPHKFIGGPGTPGLLVVNQDVLSNRVPAVPGGGTVVYVSPERHRFIEDVERREEGGTPGVVESIRAGLVFELQQQIGTDKIEAQEGDYIQRAMARLSQLDNFEILGGTELPRLSILSFNIQHGEAVLHYGFVVALLNDLFGIQARGGCSCAGPYGHDLLSLSTAQSEAIEAQILDGNMVLRPGWTRLNFNYFIDEACFEYLVSALEMIAREGWKLLSSYQYNPGKGTWEYAVTPSTAQPQSLASLLSFESQGDACNRLLTEQDYRGYLSSAQRIFAEAPAEVALQPLHLTEDAQRLRWFALPHAE